MEGCGYGLMQGLCRVNAKQHFCLNGSTRQMALPVTGVMSMVLHNEVSQLSYLSKSMLCLSRLS